jgi:hypothetical protein
MGAPPQREQQGYNNNNMNAPYSGGPYQQQQGQPDHQQQGQPNHRQQGQPDHRQQGQPDQPERRRRTKATITELSIPVQVAVMVSTIAFVPNQKCPCHHSLLFLYQVSNPRNVDQPLDGGILGMIRSSGNMALAALS